jgi:hypothetical protein
MKASFIVNFDNGKSVHNICVRKNCKPDPESKIPEFYSYKHALNAGWVAIRDFKFDATSVWVCPDCWSKEGYMVLPYKVKGSQSECISDYDATYGDIES